MGLSPCPDQAEHEKVERLLGLSEIGIELSGGYALEPEQSTAAIVVHHPQAVYFGMKSGFIPAEAKGDELISAPPAAASCRPDADPDGDGTVESESRSTASRRGTRRPLEREPRSLTLLGLASPSSVVRR